MKTKVAALIDYVESAGCYDQHGKRLDDQVPFVKAGRYDAWEFSPTKSY